MENKKVRKKSETVEASNGWWCENCKSDEMTKSEILEHLRSVHKLKTTGLKAERELVYHIDGSNFYSSQYKVTVNIPDSTGVVQLTNTSVNPRRNNDYMAMQGD